ncbi:hypothetical protein WJX81_006109 [Elliptochloris bilobata]|uniref:Uncharacterized protein n=1 Tax=Elliptochloris bilobata TaxID=381761 RepID=A0AAW1QIM5_9CHLO
MPRVAWACLVAALVILTSPCAWAEPPTAQQTLSRPAFITASSDALTGPFGPGSILGYYNKTPQALEGTPYPVETFVVVLGQLFTGMEPAHSSPDGVSNLFHCVGGCCAVHGKEHNEVSRGVAAAYALYKYANFILPLALPVTNTEDLSIPAGVGNRAGITRRCTSP